MAHIVVLGAGLGGTILAYELREKLGDQHRLSVVTNGSTYSFVPSNPWVAVGWRDRAAVEVDLVSPFKQRGIALHPEGARRVQPDERRIELNDGRFVDYDYLVIATGPELAFDEIEGLGPQGHTRSVCQVDHALAARQGFDALVANPGPAIIGAVQGRLLLRSGVRVRLHPRQGAARREGTGPGADDLRHVRALHRSPRARWRRRHQRAS